MELRNYLDTFLVFYTLCLAIVAGLSDEKSTLCGGSITEETTIQSLPHETDNNLYAENMNCVWRITGPPATSIFIEFKYFNFQKVHECSDDYVAIFAGHEISEENQKAHICGEPQQQHLIYKIPGNKALVQAISDYGSNVGKGFLATIKFRKPCDEKIEFNSGTSKTSFALNQFQKGYEDNLDCFFIFSAPKGNNIEINFHTFNLPPCSHEDISTCDFLEIRDGEFGSNLTLGIYYGDNKPPRIVSSRNKLFAYFSSKKARTEYGFDAVVNFEPSLCGRSDLYLNGSKEIVIESTDVVKYIPSTTVCQWALHYEEQGPIEIEFDEFNLKESKESNKCLDSLQVSYYRFMLFGDKHPQRTDQILCGNQIPNSFYLARKGVELILRRSNTEVKQRSGFKAKLRHAYECNVTYTALSGKVIKKNDNCEIYFKVPTGYTLSFAVENYFFELECSKMVQFYDENTKEQIQPICSPAQVAFVDSNYVKIKLVREQSEPSHPIEITYIATKNGLGCGGNLYGFEGRIPIPVYPKSNGNYTCQWDIRVPIGLQIQFRFLAIGSTRTSNQLIIAEMLDTGGKNELHLGDQIPKTFTSTTNKVSLIYNKLNGVEGPGWIISYYAYNSYESKIIGAI